MYYNDHTPPHFHVRYNQPKAIIDIETLSRLKSKLSSIVIALVLERANLHKTELMDNWEKARLNNPLKKIEPLE